MKTLGTLCPAAVAPTWATFIADGAQLWVSGRYNSVVYVYPPPTERCCTRSRSATSHTGWRAGANRAASLWATPASPVDSRQRRANCGSQLAIWRTFGRLWRVTR